MFETNFKSSVKSSNVFHDSFKIIFLSGHHFGALRDAGAPDLSYDTTAGVPGWSVDHRTGKVLEPFI